MPGYGIHVFQHLDRDYSYQSGSSYSTYPSIGPDSFVSLGIDTQTEDRYSGDGQGLQGTTAHRAKTDNRRPEERSSYYDWF